MLGTALHLRDQELSLREIAARLVITKVAENGQHPSPATVMRICASTTTSRPPLEVAESARGHPPIGP
jgi:hypothetical protein